MPRPLKTTRAHSTLCHYRRQTTRITSNEADVLARTEPPTPRTIAAGVSRTREHAAVEQRLSELRAEREALVTEQRGLIHQGKRDSRADRQIADLGEKIANVEETLRTVRAQLLPLREAHGKRVAAALAPLQRAAAARLLATLEDVEADAVL